MIGLVVLVLLPIYYLAKSKGYNAVPVCIISGIVGYLTPYALRLIGESPAFPIIDMTIPLVALLVVWLLPDKKGAPGKAYLKITFQCPECHQSITFRREREGCSELCPKCGEIVTVPTDQFTPTTHFRTKTRPHPSEGDVCLDRFTRQEDASLLQIQLESHGITSRVVSDESSGLMGAAWQDHKVIINAQDWDAAVEIQERQQNDTECLLRRK
jgi:ribosomal protein L37AE/L43A